MAIHTIQTNWRENNIFDTEIDGHTITIDLPEESGGNNAGPTPKKLLLVAAAGCTGLDIVSMARKMRIDLKNLTSASAQRWPRIIPNSIHPSM